MRQIPYLAALAIVAISSSADAHFALTTPQADQVQDSLGLPEKSAPCGQADPGTTPVATNMVTTFHEGDTITITIDEKIFHPGHYRVALADDPSLLPIEPTVTADAMSPCGSAAIQDTTTLGVLADNMLPHTAAFTAPQTFQVTLPAGKTCTNCTLQVIEFMSNHALNNPGGCFYHHCAKVSIIPLSQPLPDAGTTNPGQNDGGGTTPSSTVSGACGGCGVGEGAAGAGLALLGLALVLWPRRRTRR